MPASAWVFGLQPRSALRLGAHAEDIDRARTLAASDTLFGALCWATKAIFGTDALEVWLNGLKSGRQLRISSMLPVRWEHGKPGEVFFPLPIRKPVRQLDDRKLLRQVSFIDRATYHWLFQAEDRAEMPRRLGELLGFGLEGSEKGPPWEVQSRPRVTVDRRSGAAALYESAATHFVRPPATEGMVAAVVPGIVVWAAEVAALDHVTTCLRVLGEAGIGGERSSGLGRFELLGPHACDLPVTASPAAGPTLSLCWPSPDDREAGAFELDQDQGYRVVERGGWVASEEWSGWRSKRVAMLAEGSYLGGNGPGGGLVDVTPKAGAGHPVYRYGFGLFLDEVRL
ncbi:MAG: type III-A CRISPR-associated RAMP protein Csm4 [Dehalococcoidia bacterium]